MAKETLGHHHIVGHIRDALQRYAINFIAIHMRQGRLIGKLI